MNTHHMDIQNIDPQNEIAEKATAFYRTKLLDIFYQRQNRNSRYSLRSFAKDLSIDSSNLSAILNQKRGLPTKRAKQIAKKLGLSPFEMANFILSTTNDMTKWAQLKNEFSDSRKLNEEYHYQLIARWEYYAIMQLFFLSDFKSCPKWMAQRLQIPLPQMKILLAHLMELKLIKKDEQGQFQRLSPALETSEDITSMALKKSHQESLEIAKEKLEQIEVNKRDFSSVTFAINTQKLKQAKELIRDFQDKLDSLMASGPCDEVYMFSCQLFPISHQPKIIQQPNIVQQPNNGELKC